MPKISIIIPIYNSEKFLNKCIDSVLVQSEKDFELLLIDDGSTDKSGSVCDEYAKKDNRIRVIHKSNGGVSSARNTGLDSAVGDMIFFIDSDDTVDKDYLQKLMIIGEEDFVQSGVITLENDFLKPIMTHDEIFSNFNRFWTESRQWWSTKCCLSKKIIDDNHLRYNTNLKMGEDGLFNMFFLSKSKKIRRIEYNGYNYNYDNDASASHKLYLDRLYQQVCLMKELEKNFDDSDLWRVRWDLWNEVINHYVVKGLSSSDNNIRKKSIKKIKETYREEVFRKCLPYIKKYGSVDEKLKTHFMGYYKRIFYNFTLLAMQKFSRIKNGDMIWKKESF